MLEFFRMNSTPVILASASPRRRFLMDLTGLDYQVQPADLREENGADEPPRNYVTRLAREKALSIFSQHQGRVAVIAADTTVVDAGSILGKPADADEARAMLNQLRGHQHHVMTGLAAALPGDDVRVELCVSAVPMRDYTDEEIETYIQSGDPMDKAGAYAIQHVGFHPAAGFSGCYTGVIGLPLCHMKRMLQGTPYDLPDDIALRCQQGLGYSCPIYEAVLRGENVG